MAHHRMARSAHAVEVCFVDALAQDVSQENHSHSERAMAYGASLPRSEGRAGTRSFRRAVLPRLEPSRDDRFFLLCISRGRTGASFFPLYSRGEPSAWRRRGRTRGLNDTSQRLSPPSASRWPSLFCAGYRDVHFVRGSSSVVHSPA